MFPKLYEENKSFLFCGSKEFQTKGIQTITDERYLAVSFSKNKSGGKNGVKLQKSQWSLEKQDTNKREKR